MREVYLTRAIRIHPVDLIIAIAGGGKSDVLTICRPGGLPVFSGGICDVRHAAPVFVHQVDFNIALMVGNESETLAIRRPSRLYKMTGAFRQGSGLTASIRINHINFIDREDNAIFERDLLAIR